MTRDDACTVWWATPADANQACYSVLSPAEKVRADAYSTKLDRDRFVVGAALVRAVAGEYLSQPPHLVSVDRSCEGCGQQHGRPRIAGQSLHVSISHSGDLIGVAADPKSPIGLDIEKPDVAVPYANFLPDILTAGEKEDVRRYKTDQASFVLLRYWVRKEAILKATGNGLKVPMVNLEVTHPYNEARLRWMLGESAPIVLKDLKDRAGHFVSIAFMRRLVLPCVVELPGSDLLKGALSCRH